MYMYMNAYWYRVITRGLLFLLDIPGAVVLGGARKGIWIGLQREGVEYLHHLWRASSHQ